MKKFVSMLVVLTMLVALATTAFAATSPVGDITLVGVAGVEIEGTLPEGTLDKITEEFEIETVKVDTDWIAPIDTTTEIAAELGVEDYKFFQGATVALTEEGAALLTDGVKIKTTTVTLNVPGVTEANAPKIVSYDPATKTYTVVTTTVTGSTVSATVPVAADGLAYVAVIYTGAATSPETNVAAWAIGAVAIVALAGAVVAGKKVFAA
jgi:hypothetical protein